MVSDESAEYNTEKRKNWWKRNNWEWGVLIIWFHFVGTRTDVAGGMTDVGSGSG
jgi:hypothetical protein